jgi:hypothetical protein
MKRSRLRHQSRQTIRTRLPNVKPYIDVVGGRAKFVKTEIEDSLGRWNDNYYIRDGYWVIHEGKRHHVYFLMPKGIGSQKF